MWEFFLGVSLACFFAAYWITRGSKPKPRQREAIYAPRDEVLHYKTRKKEPDYATAAPYTFDETKPAARAATPSYNIPPTYGAPAAPAAKPFEPAVKDEFVEYTASVVTDENTVPAPNNALFEENPQKDSEDDEIDESGEKKQKFSALRFFNS